jgi:hypothetical protein
VAHEREPRRRGAEGERAEERGEGAGGDEVERGVLAEGDEPRLAAVERRGAELGLLAELAGLRQGASK